MFIGTSSKIMGNLLYVFAIILILIWLIGFIGCHANNIIHVLLVFASIIILLRIIEGKNPI